MKRRTFLGGLAGLPAAVAAAGAAMEKKIELPDPVDPAPAELEGELRPLIGPEIIRLDLKTDRPARSVRGLGRWGADLDFGYTSARASVEVAPLEHDQLERLVPIDGDGRKCGEIIAASWSLAPREIPCASIEVVFLAREDRPLIPGNWIPRIEAGGMEWRQPTVEFSRLFAVRSS